ncbi:hypothetical protein BC936DRAFT_139131 [Jimgerdemannia flammicorona]|uniref:Uncharacterized protein n=2 Tax=Jimgerdemannia flammicorona TaxID=994334 RepID=A0A433BAK6_9FUNG|nr:hypothetical protein BC936DRAFT_139131 [Jimgerdemannia flammicorona]RUS30056.1 hypothetical protein BC938DRAFT_479902 [Jimgerdemannia flammicorona]
MPQYQVAARAYALPILHAAKYPFAEVSGVLLAKKLASNDEPTIMIVDAVPLFHQWIALTPMLEVALSLIELYAAENNLQIIGYYHANEALTDHTLTSTATRIADKLRQNSTPHAVAWVIDNEKLEQEQNESAIVSYIHKENQWRVVREAFTGGETSTVSLTFTNEDTYAKVRGLLSQRLYNNLVDFDNHLDQVKGDWLRNGKVLTGDA